MARPEVLEKIQGIETEVEKIISDAEKKAEGIIEKGKKKAEGIIEKEKDKIAKTHSEKLKKAVDEICLLYTSPSPRD